jgi:hypothetical protein
MTPTLQEAIAAARRGDVERAQLLAAEVVQATPDDANAWYLLSQLVDSDARRAAYLSKTLALDPTHEQAREEVAALPADVAESLSVASLIIPPASSEPAGETLPEPEMVLPEKLPAEDTFPAAETEIAGAAADVPEWLQPVEAELAQAEVVAPPVMPVPAVPSPAPAAPPTLQAPPPPPPVKARNQGNQELTVLLVLLGLLTLAVLAFLVFLLMS